jgi:hypothetical protein
MLLCLDHLRGREAGRLEHLHHRGAAHPVQRRVDDVEVAGPVSGEPGDGVEVGVDDVLAQHPPAGLADRLPRHRGKGADRRDPGRDLGVGRRHDLAAVAEVDLVAVVLRRVVARGDHHARDRAELADRVGEQRRRQRTGEEQRGQPGAAHHLGGVLGEHVGVVPCVVPDHDGAARGRPLVAEVRRQPGRGPDHHDPVHPVRPGAERAAESRGAELERAAEPVAQLGDGIRRSAVLDTGDELAQLRPRLLVGVLGEPGACAGEEDVDVGRGHGRHRSAVASEAVDPLPWKACGIPAADLDCQMW